MAQRIEGAVEITLHLEELQARLNPEWMGKAEYRIRVWLNGLERWQSEKPVKVSEGGVAAIGVAIPMRLEFDTDVIAIQVQAAELDLLSPDDPAEGSFELYRSAGFFAGERFAIPISGADTDISLHCRVEVQLLEAGLGPEEAAA